MGCFVCRGGVALGHRYSPPGKAETWQPAECLTQHDVVCVVCQDQGGGGPATAFERAHVKFADPVELRLYEDRCASAAHTHAAFDETVTLQAVWRLYAALWEATLDSDDSTFRSNVARTAHDLSECLEVRERGSPTSHSSKAEV